MKKSIKFNTRSSTTHTRLYKYKHRHVHNIYIQIYMYICKDMYVPCVYDY